MVCSAARIPKNDAYLIRIAEDIICTVDWRMFMRKLHERARRKLTNDTVLSTQFPSPRGRLNTWSLLLDVFRLVGFSFNLVPRHFSITLRSRFSMRIAGRPVNPDFG
jgi:hypothetical protein